MSPPLPPQTESAPFRNGIPVRMSGWLSIRTSRLSRKQSRYVTLSGEVITFRLSEHLPPDDAFDIAGACVDFSDREAKRTFRLSVGRRHYICSCGSFQEMQTWAQSLCFARQHCFEKYYSLGSLIAQGTHSRVYYAYPTNDQDSVFAVKVVKKRAHDVQALEWLQRERHVNSLLNHPCIVQAVDMFSTLEKDHLVFEFMRGGTLEQLIEKHKRFPESYARVIMKHVFTALHHIHSKNIVHRDVRPQNIFCSAAKFPMSLALGDFGYANFVSEKHVNNEVLTTMIGTAPYIAVDICRRSKYGTLVDMWSAGVVLYQLLSGHVPFQGKSDRDVFEKIKKGVLKFEEPIWDSISADAKGLVLQLLQIDSMKRITALAALQHRWLTNAALSRPPSVNTSCPASPTTFGLILGDRGSPGTTSTDSRRHNHIPSSASNFSRNPSSSSSQSPPGSVQADNLAWSARQASLLGSQSSQRGGVMPAVASLSSLSSAQPRMQVTPSVRAIAIVGLQRVASDNPARMKRLLSSSVVQKQLSVALPFRRKLVIAARAFVAVFRLQALIKGQSCTRNLSLIEKCAVDDVQKFVDQRTEPLKKRNKAKAKAKASNVDDGNATSIKRRGVNIEQRLSVDRPRNYIRK